MALSPTDKALWARLTQGVRRLDGAPTSPIQGKNWLEATTPRQSAYHPSLDLHGLTIHAAHSAVLDHVYQGRQMGYRVLTVISGRSGQINAEMPRWLEGHRDVRSIESMNGGGAWKICLKRRDM